GVGGAARHGDVDRARQTLRLGLGSLPGVRRERTKAAEQSGATGLDRLVAPRGFALLLRSRARTADRPGSLDVAESGGAQASICRGAEAACARRRGGESLRSDQRLRRGRRLSAVAYL